MTLSEKIREVAKKQFKSIRSLATKAGVGYSSAYGFWHAKKDVRAKTVDAIANACGITADKRVD